MVGSRCRPAPRRSPAGTTLVEILFVGAILLVLLALLIRIVTSAYWGTKRGVETLSVLQEEARLLSWLKHDLRTIIHGTDAAIPRPVLTRSAQGDTTFIFHTVESVDALGRPITVKVTYASTGEAVQPVKAGGPTRLFSVERRAGDEHSPPRTFLRRLATEFTIELLDAHQQPLAPDRFDLVRKIRVGIRTQASERLQVTVSIYSPYIVAYQGDSPPGIWLNNYEVRSFSPSGLVLTYDDVPLEPDEYDLIPGAQAIALDREF